MDVKERIRRSPPPPTPQAAPAPGHPRGTKGRVAVLPLSVAALVACGVLLLLLSGGSAARRGGQFLDADPATARPSGDGRGGLHQARPRDGTPETKLHVRGHRFDRLHPVFGFLLKSLTLYGRRRDILYGRRHVFIECLGAMTCPYSFVCFVGEKVFTSYQAFCFLQQFEAILAYRSLGRDRHCH